MKKAKKGKKINKKALMTAIAFSVGATAQAAVPPDIDQGSLFKLKEVSSQSTLIAGAEGNCGEGKCGEGKEATTKARGAEANCGMKKMFKKWFGGKKKTTVKAKSTEEAKCGEDKCGEGKCG